MTSLYSEFIGKEPSLYELREFIDNHYELFENINVHVIKEYLKFCKDYSGSYYVGGQIKLLPSDPITDNSIIEARSINDKVLADHRMEISSLIHSKNNLDNLEKILNVYYEYKIMEYYAPPSNHNITGGEGYIKIANETMIGKK